MHGRLAGWLAGWSCAHHRAHGCTPGCTHTCAHVKTAPCTRAPVRAVVFQPERPTATVCAFSRAIRIVSRQLGRSPEPWRCPVAAGFAHTRSPGFDPGKMVAHGSRTRVCAHACSAAGARLAPPPKTRKLAPCARVPVRTVNFQPECPIAISCAFSRAIQIVSGQLGRSREP